MKASGNILVVGVGGQGVMTAAEVLAETALAAGYDVKKTEVAGMSQRGGVVTSHVRFADKVYSPQITTGEVDILVGFEAAEALRWQHTLRPDGVAMVNTLQVVPPVVTIGLFPYPADPIAQLADTGRTLHHFDAGAIAYGLGEPKLVNTVMLGAIADLLPFAPEALEECILARFRRRKPQLVELNHQAFMAGRAAGRAA